MRVSEAFPPKSAAVANFGEAEQIGRALKGHRTGKGWIAKCPCHDDRTASLSITEGENGTLLMKCFAGSGCQFKDIVSELQRLGHMGTDRLDRARRTLAPYIRSVSTEHVPDARAAWLWNASVPLHGTPAQTYLERRGILIAPPSLRYCAGSRAMIAGFQRPDGKLVAVQATFLTIEGEKVTGRPARLTYGSMRGGAVRLAAGAEVMGLAEGTETGLSAMAMSGVPVWVALGGGRMHDVALPDFVREVHIFGDNDTTGREAARRTADVHLQHSRRVALRFPPDGVKDFNDLLMAHADRQGSVAA